MQKIYVFLRYVIGIQERENKEKNFKTYNIWEFSYYQRLWKTNKMAPVGSLSHCLPLLPCFVMDCVTAGVSHVALCMHVTRYSLGHVLLCAVRLCELHCESPGCCCAGATLEPQHVLCWLHEVTFWLCLGCTWLHCGCCYSSCFRQDGDCVMAAMPPRREWTCLCSSC